MGNITISLEEYQRLLDKKTRLEIIKQMHIKENYPDTNAVNAVLGIKEEENDCTTKG